ncbi:MAG TPA: transcriptional repressor LexA [Candidatus Paceibacterota bacterium]|nr:transcriptional repressor LexA [Candidatus Paceibacterota bacterium]
MFTYYGRMTPNALDKLRTFFRSNGRMPTFRELARLWGFRSTNAVAKLVRKLTDTGALVRDRAGRLALADPFSSVRLLGAVEAGWPSPAEEELADTMSLDEWLVRNREATFMLKVQGSSMTGAGIMPGDVILVERGAPAREGDIVVAEVDNAWTVKYLRRRSGRMVLEPANEAYKTIIPSGELNIAAVVKAVIRKY